MLRCHVWSRPHLVRRQQDQDPFGNAGAADPEHRAELERGHACLEAGLL